MSSLIKCIWKSIDKDNETTSINNIIFKRKKNLETIPVECPVCSIYLITQEDIESYRKVKCCENCQLVNYYPNKDKWDKGWRPNLLVKEIIIDKDEVKND